MKENKLRIGYAISTLALTIIEVIIALYVHDNFVRPYIGDVLVVIVVYCVVRIIVPLKYRLLPLYVFIFAGGVELLQYFDFVTKFGLDNNFFLKTLIGSVFDVKDIVCYAVGGIVLGIYEIVMRKYMKKKKLIIVLIIFAIIISSPFVWYYAIGPRYCSDGVSNERCLYYKFNVYHSLEFIDKSDSLENYGITLKRQVTDTYIKEWWYLATDKNGDEIIVVEYIDHSVVFKK